jgi:hypothetical protein
VGYEYYRRTTSVFFSLTIGTEELKSYVSITTAARKGRHSLYSRIDIGQVPGSATMCKRD